MELKVKRIKTKISGLSMKIANRLKELENETLDNYINLHYEDALISETIGKIWNLYYEGREICKRHNLKDGVCSYFNYEPRIFRELDLCEACARARTYLKKNYCSD